MARKRDNDLHAFAACSCFFQRPKPFGMSKDVRLRMTTWLHGRSCDSYSFAAPVCSTQRLGCGATMRRAWPRAPRRGGTRGKSPYELQLDQGFADGIEEDSHANGLAQLLIFSAWRPYHDLLFRILKSMLGIIFALLAFIAAGVLAINNHENLVDGTTTSRHADACKANAVLGQVGGAAGRRRDAAHEAGGQAWSTESSCPPTLSHNLRTFCGSSGEMFQFS